MLEQSQSPVCRIGELSVLAYANGFTIWHCVARQFTMREVLESSFWKEVSDMLTSGDLLHISIKGGGVVVRVVSVEDPYGTGRVRLHPTL